MTTPSSVPIWPRFVAPVLQVLASGDTASRREVKHGAMDIMGLSDEARAERMESGWPRAENRADWAITHVTKASWIERVSRGHYRISDVGRTWLAAHPEGLHDFAAANRIFGEFWEREAIDTASALGEAPMSAAVAVAVDPIEQIDAGVARIHTEVAADLLQRLHAQAPAFFEQAVLDLLVAMGYGGAEGRATRTSLTNDGGIDGIVDQDALGLSRIYVQAKRYAVGSAVLRPEIQAFVGALHGNQAGHGVFITTARFSAGAEEYAKAVPTRVVLIDGPKLASLMIKYGVGVQVRRTVTIVEIDEDFFE